MWVALGLAGYGLFCAFCCGAFFWPRIRKAVGDAIEDLRPPARVTEVIVEVPIVNHREWSQKQIDIGLSLLPLPEDEKESMRTWIEERHKASEEHE